MLEIKKIVDQHTEFLVAHGRELAAIREVQTQHGEMLGEILRLLDAR